MRVAIVAGETSGDLLAADLLTALTAQQPGIQAEGVTGPALRAAGCATLEDMESLSLMGLSEVLREVPRLWQLRQRLLQHWSDDPPDVLIGVDAPDFNLGLERRLKARGIKTVHYVSPTVWAWRPGRVHGIARAADRLLCLLPFEPDCYAQTDLKAVFVGHPFAAQMQAVPPRETVRQELGIGADEPVLALLPGSRRGEIARLGAPLAGAVAQLKRRLPTLRILVPAANPGVLADFSRSLEVAGVRAAVDLHDGRLRELVRAADVALVTSGTATLETMLLGTPFVVAYRASAVTNWLLRDLGLLKIPQVALPNILAGREVAPEFLQQAASAGNLAAACYQLLTRPHLAQAQREAFAPLARQLDKPSGELAAREVLSLCAAG